MPLPCMAGGSERLRTDWDVGDDLQVKASRGWYDSEDYAWQVAGGIP